MMPDFFFNPESTGRHMAQTIYFVRELPPQSESEEYTKSPQLEMVNIIFVVAFAVFISWLAKKLAGRGRRGKK